MAGICGVFSDTGCRDDLLLGTHYLQHRAQDYCGLGLSDGRGMKPITHEGKLGEKFPEKRAEILYGAAGIGCVTTDRQPVSSFSQAGGMLLAFDGNVINYLDLRSKFLDNGAVFTGHHKPKEVNDSVIISRIIAGEREFATGIEKLLDVLRGDFAVVALREEGIYAARGYGRKPLILGRKDPSKKDPSIKKPRYMVSSESVSFDNAGFDIVRDVNPGEVVLINEDGIKTIKQFDVPVCLGTFEWIYTADPDSIIDGINVAQFRIECGRALAKRYPVKADFIAPFPNSGIYHALGFHWESGIPFSLPFYRYPYSDRSFTRANQEDQLKEARKKLNAIESLIRGHSFILIDDSMVRGSQSGERIGALKEKGATELYAFMAMLLLDKYCPYGKTTKPGELIGAVKSVPEMQAQLKLDGLYFSQPEDILNTVTKLSNGRISSLDQLCLECAKGF